MSKAAACVGVRALKYETSAVLGRVRRGETITITDRNEAIALLVPLTRAPGDETVRKLVGAGRLSWSGGKPSGASRRVRMRGPSLSDAVLEDRR